MGQGGSKIVRVDITDTFDPRLLGRAAQKGTLFRFIPAAGDAELLIKQDDGFTTNWTSLGEGSSGPLTTVKAASTANVDVANPPATLDTAGGVVGNLWLLKNQTAPAENGVYIFNGAAIPLTRAVGWDQAEEFVPGREVFVDDGATQADTLWVNTDLVPVLGVDPVDFDQVATGSFMLRDFSNALPAANAIDMGANLINDVLDPVAAQDAATKNYVDTLVAPLTGTPNTGAFFDAGGALNSSVDYAFAIASFAMSFILKTLGGTGSAAGSGALAHGATNNTADLTASGAGAHAHGTLNAAGSTVLASGGGSTAHGVATAGGDIVASGDSSLAHGLASGAGANVTALGESSHAHGTVAVGCTITTTAIGAVAHGHAENVGSMTASGVGSQAFGYSSGATLVASGIGALAHGSTDVAGDLSASATGAYAAGNAFGGIIRATGIGSVAFGQSATAANLQADGVGSITSGDTDAGILLAQGSGSMVIGAAYTGGRLNTQNEGSVAAGMADGTGGICDIFSTGVGSVATGQVLALSTMTASQAGALAQGQAADSSVITASAIGAQARGDASAASQILASGVGSFVSGVASAGNNISSSGRGSLVMGISALGAVTSSGIVSVVVGEECTVTANYSQTFGRGQVNSALGCMVIGRFGVSTGTFDTWTATEPLFVAGNGANIGAPANAYRLDKDGKITETGANVVPVRIITGNDVLSARTDRKFILNDVAAGANVITLPAGEAGLTYDFGFATGSTGTWTLTPNGADAVDAALATAIAATSVNSFSMTFTGGTWYLV